MGPTVYVVGALTTCICAFLLLRGFFHSRQRLLLWSGLCFVGLAISNSLIFVDLVLFPDVNLYRVRLADCGRRHDPLAIRADLGERLVYDRWISARRHRHHLGHGRTILPEVLEDDSRLTLPCLWRVLHHRRTEPMRRTLRSETE